MWVLLTTRSTPANLSGTRPSACVTSSARRAGEWARTASTIAGRGIMKPLKKLTNETVRRRVRGPSKGTRSSMRSPPPLAFHSFTVAGQVG